MSSLFLCLLPLHSYLHRYAAAASHPVHSADEGEEEARCTGDDREGKKSQRQQIRPRTKQQHILPSIKASPTAPSYLLNHPLFLTKLTLTRRATQHPTQIVVPPRFLPTPLCQLSTHMQRENTSLNQNDSCT